MEQLWTSNVTISNSSKEKFQQQIYCKNWFSNRLFYVTIADADIVSLKSLHTIFDKYLDHMLVKFEQNRMVWTIQNFELFEKMVKHLTNKVLMPFWKTFVWLKQLFDAKLLI